MSTIDQVLERVSRLDEARAGELLAWLDQQQTTWLDRPASILPMGAKAMIGFARHEGRVPRTTENWMHELREGEAD